LVVLTVSIDVSVLRSVAAHAGEIELLREKADPYGFPRPTPGEVNVPLATSFFFEIGFKEKETDDVVLSDSVTVRIGPRGGEGVEVLKRRGRFADGYSGSVLPSGKEKSSLLVYIDGQTELAPSTTYRVSVGARSRDGAVLDAEKGTWQFTTEAAPKTHRVAFHLDLKRPPVRWHGGFFTGFCKPSFCTSTSNRVPGYELMARVREQYPRAWSLQRDISITGMERRPRFLSWNLPNVVRERETRRIVAMEKRDEGILLRLEDFFGHEQYGIPSGRALSGDYRPGDEVLIADGVSDARPKVVAVVDDSPESRSLLVTPFETPAAGWKMEYARPLPEEEDPDAPGLFPPGGCHLIRFDPPGTPHYYWERLDKEWDIARRFNRRLIVNFTDAPGDLAVDGRDWTFPKDYAEYHEVVHAYTTHLIERYGDACLDFVWSVFNEPDLARAFWRSGDWNELQKYYDYTVDAVLRAFEDKGYDSDRVVVGGLEIGAIFGTHVEKPVLKIFLCHCSPGASCPGELEKNAALADKRLDGKRSRRVEKLCGPNDGKGSPCDFISVHSYNASEMTAAKLIRAKEVALETDAERYADLWVNSFESCPDWAPPADVAAADSYLGNGYFPTWCADVSRRLLSKAADDERYGFGETILTFWPWPNPNFGGHNASTRRINVDDDGDGHTDHHETVAMPILHFLGLTSGMGDDYWVLPEHEVGGHVVSGFASKKDAAAQVLLYSHHRHDTQSRSEAAFEITLEVDGIPWPKARVKEYRFDKDHNSYYRLGRKLRERRPGGTNAHRAGTAEVEKLVADLRDPRRDVQIAAVKKAASLGEVAQVVFTAVLRLYEETDDLEVRAAIEEATRQVLTRQVCYRPEEVAEVRALSALRVTGESNVTAGPGGKLELSVAISANGASFVVLEPFSSDTGSRPPSK
jgi:hypothetical protein